MKSGFCACAITFQKQSNSRQVVHIPGDVHPQQQRCKEPPVSHLTTVVQILYTLHSPDTPFKFRSVAMFVGADLPIYHVIFARFYAVTVTTFTRIVVIVRPQRNDSYRKLLYDCHSVQLKT